jgi:hypothetical protein
MALREAAPTRIIDSRHPSFLSSMNDWEKWRLTYKGGDEFKQRYLERFNVREDQADFKLRSKLTPVPAFAKAAINDIRNSIFQRMRDITRVGGSQDYRNAVAGLNLGVDRRGSSMNAFLGQKVLSDLLVMGRCGVFVDNSVIEGNTLADSMGARPYLYAYQIEDILSWTCASPDDPSQFQSLLLRDTCIDYDRRTLLPLTSFQRFRLLWLEAGKVMLQFYAMNGSEIDRDGNPSKEPTALELDRIPFVMPDLGDSLIKDVCQHQISLLNLTSRDVWYALQANFPFYIEQRDLRAIGSHLKQASTEDGTATTGGQAAGEQNIVVGANHGRAYGKDLDAPGFIAPPTAPLQASIALQEKLEGDIRKLVNLSVQTMATRGSAESKSMDNQGLEAGLSFIGLVLESTERQIAEYWAAYENKNAKQREIATVKYPDRYSLKTDSDRIDESTKLSKLIYSVPGRLAKKEIAKNIVTVLLSGKVDVGTIDSIHKEIDAADYLTSEPNTIIQAFEAGLSDTQTASEALGFDPKIAPKAIQEEKQRAADIAAAQSQQQPGPTVVKGAKQALRSLQNPAKQGEELLTNPAARGVPALSVDPRAAAKAEKAASRDTTFRTSKRKRVRGNNKDARVTGAENQ